MQGGKGGAKQVGLTSFFKHTAKCLACKQPVQAAGNGGNGSAAGAALSSPLLGSRAHQQHQQQAGQKKGPMATFLQRAGAAGGGGSAGSGAGAAGSPLRTGTAAAGAAMAGPLTPQAPRKGLRQEVVVSSGEDSGGEGGYGAASASGGSQEAQQQQPALPPGLCANCLGKGPAGAATAGASGSARSLWAEVHAPLLSEANAHAQQLQAAASQCVRCHSGGLHGRVACANAECNVLYDRLGAARRLGAAELKLRRLALSTPSQLEW